MSSIEESTMYSADISSIAKASTHSTPGTTIDVTKAPGAAVQPYATGGNASATGNVTFYISGSLDGVKWSPGVPITIILNGTTEVVAEPWKLDLEQARFIRVESIDNDDADYTATNVNVIIWGNR